MPSYLAGQLDLVGDFHQLFYQQAWNTRYRGVPVIKNPLDLWVYQEILHEVKPGWIIETGTFAGGSALYLADLCEAMGHGQVITIDIELNSQRQRHSRVTYVQGDSATVELRPKPKPWDDSPVLVILDSDHSKAHVAKELERFAQLVTKGSYLIVEDTNISGHPIEDYSGDPMGAVLEFLSTHPEFEPDRSREKYLISQNPFGYLRRIA